MKKKKNIVIVLVLVILLALGYGAYKFFSTHWKGENHQLVSEIKEYNYILYDDQKGSYKELFKQLVDELNKDKIDEKKYATIITKLYIMDFYTLSNKKTKNDIGGVQFIYESSQENFVAEASDTIYKYLENNLNNDRTQELPKVVDVDILEDSIVNIPFIYDENEDPNAFQIKATVNYEKDLGYPKELTIILIHSEIKKEEEILQKLEIVSINEGEI